MADFAREDGRMPTFYTYAEGLRDCQAEKLFVQDKLDIPASEEFSYTMHCPLAHPGLCSEKDAAHLPTIHVATRSLRRLIKHMPQASAFCLWSVGADDRILHTEYFLLSHFRGSGPCVGVLAEATRTLNGYLEVRQTCVGGFQDTLDISLVGRFFLHTPTHDFSLYCGELPEDTSICNPCGHKVLVDWDAFRNDPSSCHCIFPTPPRPKKEKKDKMTKVMEKAMSDLDSLDKVPAQKLAERGIRICYPGAGCPEESSEDGHGSLPDIDTEEEPAEDGAPKHITDPAVKKVKAYAVAVHGAQLLINTSGNSIDAKCFLCNGGADRTYKERASAAQIHTKAQGRMMGAHLLWLSLECGGDAAWHCSQYCLEGLPRNMRKQKRAEALAEGLLNEFFDKEREARADESDGEPMGVPTSWRQKDKKL